MSFIQVYKSKLIFKDNRWMVIDISSLMKWKEMIANIPDFKIDSEMEKFEESLKGYLPLHPNPERYDGVDPTPYIREHSLSNMIDGEEYYINYKVVNDSTITMVNYNSIEYAIITND